MTAIPDSIQILCEIVGATNVRPHPDIKSVSAVTTSFLLGDVRPASTFVKVRHEHSATKRKHDVHVTKTILDNNGPIWAADTGSLFLLSLSRDDFALGRGNRSVSSIVFELYDKDNLLGATAKIGKVRLSSRKLAKILTERSEKRIEFEIDNSIFLANSEEEDRDESDQTDENALLRTKLALRFRIATKQDVRFVENLRKGGNQYLDDDEGYTVDNQAKENILPRRINLRSSGLNTDKDAGLGGIQSMVSTMNFALNASGINEAGEATIRVKPGPDPTRIDETTFMTEEDMLIECHQPSQNWIEAGSGFLGKVFVEVLKCQGLPNMDVGMGNLTDAFVSLIFEDAMVQTNTIDDCLSPQFMPWTQRAFAFNRMHPLSALYIGVFDFDNGPTEHDGIGRCCVNLENFRPGVTYTLTYALYPNSVLTEREAKGSITIRLRLETPDEKSLLIESRKPMPRIHVNVKKPKSLAVAQYTLHGDIDESKYNMTLLRSHVNEIMEYKRRVSYTIADSVRSLIFWRGQVKVGSVKVPLHSLGAFVIGTWVVERPHLWPSFLCIFVAWVMMANYTTRRSHPFPWKQCTSMSDFLAVICKGGHRATFSRILPQEGAEAARQMEEAWKHRLESDFDKANKEWEMQRQLVSIGEERIHTDEAKIKLDPLEKWLFPIQQRLCGVCTSLRRLNLLITWEDSFSSFWFTLTFVGLGVVLFILPTAWILHWVLRITTYTLLGPWMKGVDLFILAPSVAFEDEEERRKHRQKTLKDIARRFNVMSKAARTKGEEAMKLKAMRKLRFGDYIARVPERNITRHLDYPLPQSHARTYANQALRGWEERKVVPGQKLYGCMIPRRNRTKEDEKRHAEALLRRLLAGESMANESNDKSESRTSFNDAEVGEQGIEIKLCEPVACRRRKKNQLRKIPEDGEENNKHDDGDDETMVSFMLIPSHITMPAYGADDSSITSSLGPDTPKVCDGSVEVVALFKDQGKKDEIVDSETIYFELDRGC